MRPLCIRLLRQDGLDMLILPSHYFPKTEYRLGE